MMTALVLAAGAGERLGSPKALVELDGRTFLDRVLSPCAESLVDEAVVVTGARADDVEALAGDWARRHPELPVRVVRNDRWEEGRTGSIQRAWADASPGAHVLLFPVDHPAVEVTTLDVLLGVFGYAAAQPEVIVPVVEIDGTRRRGHPIVMAARLRDVVESLRPDASLREALRGREQLECPVDDEGILLDVNTADDLDRARRLLRSRA